MWRRRGGLTMPRRRVLRDRISIVARGLGGEGGAIPRRSAPLLGDLDLHNGLLLMQDAATLPRHGGGRERGPHILTTALENCGN